MEPEPFLLRIYRSDGTIESFALRNAAQASGICQKAEAARLFAQPRLVVAGECFKFMGSSTCACPAVALAS